MTATFPTSPISFSAPGWLMPPAKDADRDADERIGMALRAARKRAWGVYGSLARTAQLAGVSQGTLSMVERGEHSLSKVRTENLQNFPAAYGMSPHEFAELTGVTLVIPTEESGQWASVQPMSNMHRVPVRSLAAAGTAFYTDGAVVDYEYIPHDLYRPEMLVVKVCGDSMSPALEDGDYVYVDTRRCDVMPGKIVLAHLHGDGYVLKRVRVILGTAALDSDNPTHGAVSSDEATVVGTAYHRQPKGNSL